MDWKSRKVAAVLEAALAEDKATSDVTTALTINPDQRASATVLVRQDCVIAGLARSGQSSMPLPRCRHVPAASAEAAMR